MDDELGDLFLLNDCLISGHLSPGLPDDFLGHGTRDALLTAGSHNSDSSYLCYDNLTSVGYNAVSPRRRSLDGTISTSFIRNSADNGKDETANFLLFNIKSEDQRRCLSPPSDRSPDHDYVHDVKVEVLSDPIENGDDGYGAVNICSSKRTLAVDTRSEENGTKNYHIEENYTDDGDGDAMVVGDGYVVEADHSRNADFRLVQTTEANGNGLVDQSTTLNRGGWPCSPVSPKEEDATPLADDNSSTTSGDSCSNCGYLSPASPGPLAYQRDVRVACASPYQINSRYRSVSQLSEGNVNLNLRNRSKMHELAVKHKLISEQDPRAKGYVLLSVEERRTLIQEGLPVPTKLPLSKHEEEALKIVRRKIKNKLSAQESRRKRKEYMETLEQQIEGYQSENSSLRRRIDNLEKTNQSLMGQLKKLQEQFASENSHVSATALVAGKSQGQSTTSSRGSTNVHHTVSLAAVFLLFAVMIPAMPIWPTVFRSAFIMNAAMATASNHHDVSSAAGVYSDHSSDSFSSGASRVLSSNNGDCDVPYSAEYFEKLNECRQDDFVMDHDFGTETAPSVPEQSTAAPLVLNDTDDFIHIPIQELGYSTAPNFHQASSAAVCGSAACREAVAVS